MDLNDINKVANRKRINTEAEKLREKVSRETAKIIKLKVAQDTAYWDLKEKLQQVESNHEKLQQNMVEVQMQHEAISGQYQEELRLRPDTLNKVSSTREMCGVLQEYSERLRDTLSRCAADQAALSEAYQRSGQLVKDLRAQQAAEVERSRAHVAGLQEKVQLLTDHQSQLVQLFTAAKQQADAQINGLRDELASTVAHREALVTAQNELNRQLDQCKFDIEKKEEINANLHAEMKKLMQEFNSQTTVAKATLADQDLEIKKLTEENQSLKKAVENQDQFTKSICEQNNILQEKIAVLEDEHLVLLRTIDEFKVKMEEASTVTLNLESNIKNVNEEKQNLLQQVQDTLQTINDLEAEMKNIQAEHTKVANEKNEIMLALNAATEESNNKSMEVEKLSALRSDLETTVTELEATFKAHRDVSDEKVKELSTLIEAKDSELDSKANTISQLMSQLKTSSEIRSKLEGVLQKMKNEIEIERDSVKKKENEMINTIGKLETNIRDKNEELSKQMSMMLEMRNEKERLQDKIQSMQNTIDNIQKELTRPPPQAAVPRLQPELDDNAVMLTPSQKKTQLLQPPSPTLQRPAPAQFAVPRTQEPDSLLYSLFSDSSMEGDSMDTSVVNRRFSALARGERLSPAPLAALKRRGGVSAAQNAGGLRHKHAVNNDTQVSLSQVKDDLKNKERTFFKNKPKRAK